MRSLTKAAPVMLVIGFTVGMKFYNQSATAKDAKQAMLSVCETDVECSGAVNTYFERCFDSSYSMGSRRRAGRLNSQKLADCINKGAGVAYFQVAN